ncbi:MAG: M16 family metallopeptidase [Candidatus Sericytochromatia bacterium]
MKSARFLGGPQALALALTLALLAPLSGCAGLLRQADAQAKPAQARAESLPAPVRVKLSNGLTLLVIERRNLPIVSVSAIVRAGGAYDPAHQAGLASLTASLLERGTTTRTAPQIAEAIDFVGGSLSVGAGLDSTSAGLSVLKKDLDTGLGVFADVLMRPTFPEAELKRVKEEATANLRSSLDDADEVARMAFERSLLAGHPYGTSATIGTLGRINRADLVTFYETYYRPNNAFMAVVGDLSPEEATAKFEQVFKGWAAKPVTLPALKAPTAPTERRVVLVDMPVNQSFIRLGNLGVQRNHADYFPLIVLNFILGGDFTSRLNQEIRDRQGLAYGAGSRFAMNLAAGTFTASLNTKSQSTGQALRAVLGEVRKMQEAPVSAAELAFAKDYLTGAFPLRFETNADLAREVVNMEFFGLAPDYLATYRERVRAVGADDVQRVARQYLHPEAYQLVVVAKAQDVAQELKAFGTLGTLDRQVLIR